MTDRFKTIFSLLVLTLCAMTVYSQQSSDARPPLPALSVSLSGNLYPENAKKVGMHGRVLVEFSISRRGAPDEPQVVAAEPVEMFDEAALRFVRQVRFAVPKDWRDSGGVLQRYRLSVLFKLTPCLPDNCIAPKMHEGADDFLIITAERP